MNALVRYEQARAALAECARIDEASEIRDKAAALAAYARQRDDRDLEVWVREIQLRACVRIGELSRDIDRAEPSNGHGAGLPTGGKTKAEALADAGLTTSTAHRYEELAGSRDARAQSAGKAAMEAYFAKSRVERAPPTMSGLRSAVREAEAARSYVEQIDRERVWVPSRDEFVELVPDALQPGEMREAGEYLLQHGADCIRRGRLLVRLAEIGGGITQ